MTSIDDGTPRSRFDAASPPFVDPVTKTTGSILRFHQLAYLTEYWLGGGLPGRGAVVSLYLGGTLGCRQYELERHAWSALVG